MKKKILIIVAIVATLCLGITAVIVTRSSFSFKRADAAAPAVMDALEENAPADREKSAGEATVSRRAAPAAPESEMRQEGYATKNQDAKGGDLGKIFAVTPERSPVGSGRRLEYNIATAYQIESLKAARAFFNQWIPRYGFLLNESASGHNNGYMNLRVRVRVSNLYAALHDLDAIGVLNSENITVTDHTENAVYQQMLAAREEIRNRRRTIANAATGTNSKNWEATENLLSQSEDRQLASRMEEWRIGDRTEWATLQVTLSLPAAPVVTPVEVPEFRNAFVGLLNVLLQVLYAAIYIVPLLAIGYIAWRGIARLLPTLRRIVPGNV